MVLTAIAFSVAACKRPELIDQTKFESLYRAARAVQGATSVGVNHRRFGELLQTLATELSIVQDKAKTPEEKRLVGQYGDVVETYMDSFTIWSRNLVSHGYSTGVAGLPTDRIHINEEIEPIVKKYELPTEDHIQDYTGVHYQSVPVDSVEVLWAKAEAKLKMITESSGTKQ